ncbi:hypothetical protein HYH03_014874 [Edaphochlamys debaryana]|uniref:Galactose oxidase n=1 Tax=Edaphochlamys debaryana TaxID=47281 RepID=A0A835XN71_9CHLO|nr:hypothetical protein HYH03_014874 [Edaphochlamys debaryana]|eukprot:KAG2486427.1 hypothetical protein HYH03_014874 [Edaphochlamys debaryana]
MEPDAPDNADRPFGPATPSQPQVPAPPLQPLWPPLAPSPPPFPPSRVLPPNEGDEELRRIGSYRRAATSMIVAVHMAAIPGTDRFLFMERPSGYHPDNSRTIAGFLDVPTGKWTHIFSPDGLFCCGHTMLDSGNVLIVGGHQANAGYPDGMKSIRTFDRSCTDLQLRKVREMGWRRWYPSATLLPDGRVLIMGGTQGVGAGTANNPFWELYNPRTNAIDAFAMRPGFLDASNQIYYPFNYVLPSGHMFVFCGRVGFILDWTTNTWRQPMPRLRGYGNTQFPFTGTSVMLGLYPERDYKVEVMLFGGQREYATKDLSVIANRGVNRMSLDFDASTGNYTFGDGWVEEQMSRGRVMPDSVLLPNGRVVILNGANEGLAGDSAGGGESRADYPVLYAEEYNPYAPRGQRFTEMAWTNIARMYHSTACLTTNGTVLVAGCDRCYRFVVNDGWDISYSPTSKAEYRVEIYTPPYVYFENVKPAIVSTQDEVMPYGGTFRVVYGFPSIQGGGPGGAPLSFNATRNSPPNGRGNGNNPQLRVTQAVLVAPCSCTHSFNTHQRLVGLEIVSNNAASGELVVRGPPTINIAPPGMYMLFILNGDIYSRASWVKLERP